MAFIAQRSAVTLITSNWYSEKRMLTKNKNGRSRSILGLLPWALLGGKVKREK